MPRFLSLIVLGALSCTTSASHFHHERSALLLRGGEAFRLKKKIAAPKFPIKAKAPPAHHHEEELMSAPTAVANVLADLCPHGMLPIGKYRCAPPQTSLIHPHNTHSHIIQHQPTAWPPREARDPSLFPFDTSATVVRSASFLSLPLPLLTASFPSVLLPIPFLYRMEHESAE